MSDDIVNMIQKITVLNKLSKKELKNISGYLDCIEINKDANIFFEGGPGEFVCFVVEGTLDITKKSFKGNEIGIATLSQGDSIGEMALIDEMNRSATVTARTDSKLLILTKDKFDRLVEESPIIGVEILKGIAKTLSLHLRRTLNNLSIEN